MATNGQKNLPTDIGIKGYKMYKYGLPETIRESAIGSSYKNGKPDPHGFYDTIVKHSKMIPSPSKYMLS